MREYLETKQSHEISFKMNSIKFKDISYLPSKIICVGKNYADHSKEMGDKSIPKEPVIFLKPNSALVQSPAKVDIPSSLGLLHHEVELCFLIGKVGKDVSISEAKNHICAFSVGIDFTLREKQKSLKEKGHPWELAKGFDDSAVIGEFSDLNEISDLQISLKINNDLKQNSNTNKMIFTPYKILSFISEYMTLKSGDIVMCGTPEGVGPVSNADEIEAEISGIPVLKFKVIRD